MVGGDPALGTQQLRVLVSEHGDTVFLSLLFPLAPCDGHNTLSPLPPLDVRVVGEVGRTGHSVLCTSPVLVDAGVTEGPAVRGHWVPRVVQGQQASAWLMAPEVGEAIVQCRSVV